MCVLVHTRVRVLLHTYVVCNFTHTCSVHTTCVCLAGLWIYKDTNVCVCLHTHRCVLLHTHVCVLSHIHAVFTPHVCVLLADWIYKKTYLGVLLHTCVWNPKLWTLNFYTHICVCFYTHVCVYFYTHMCVYFYTHMWCPHHRRRRWYAVSFCTLSLVVCRSVVSFCSQVSFCMYVSFCICTTPLE